MLHEPEALRLVLQLLLVGARAGDEEADATPTRRMTSGSACNAS